MLGSRGWHEVPIKGDGACFFRSVSYLIFGTEERHGELRAKTMDYIESQSDFFAPFILEPLPGYVKRKRQPGEYANNVEIQAVACLLARNVEVYRYSMEPVTIEPFIYGEGDAPPPADRPLRLAYKHEVHYNAIVV
ncbi:hypothetical protein DFJ74DRAFT_668019 [Hyaloraphidium curvatum]|nr:hypothetical protein DFJ74DRAFT_668019 [Hyaloraphidium curvatum]